MGGGEWWRRENEERDAESTAGRDCETGGEEPKGTEREIGEGKRQREGELPGDLEKKHDLWCIETIIKNLIVKEPSFHYAVVVRIPASESDTPDTEQLFKSTKETGSKPRGQLCLPWLPARDVDCIVGNDHIL